MDSVLAGKAKRAWRILQQLEQEDVEPVILIRTFQRELNLVAQLKADSMQSPIGAVFDKHRIWQSKRPIYNAALQRLTLPQIQKLYKGLANAEISSKTQYEHSIWPLIAQLTLEFSSTSPPTLSELPFES